MYYILYIKPTRIMDYSNDIYRNTAVSWTLHALKSLLGLKTVRNKVIKYFYPTIENLAKAETFDAFQPPDALLAYCCRNALPIFLSR